jgi:xanthine dehydrogenase accessory factor
VNEAISDKAIPVLVDPEGACIGVLGPQVLVDGRMRKAPPEIRRGRAPLFIGLGPGFTAGVDCDAVVETKRGPHLGRVLWRGTAEEDTRVPEPIRGFAAERVLRAPAAGNVIGRVTLGSTVRKGQAVADVGGVPVTAPFDGVLRGLLHDGLGVEAGMKIGDIDPRGDPALCALISDKALAVGGGVVEAALSQEEIRRGLGQ